MGYRTVISTTKSTFKFWGKLYGTFPTYFESNFPLNEKAIPNDVINFVRDVNIFRNQSSNDDDFLTKLKVSIEKTEREKYWRTNDQSETLPQLKFDEYCWEDVHILIDLDNLRIVWITDSIPLTILCLKTNTILTPPIFASDLAEGHYSFIRYYTYYFLKFHLNDFNEKPPHLTKKQKEEFRINNHEPLNIKPNDIAKWKELGWNI